MIKLLFESQTTVGCWEWDVVKQQMYYSEELCALLGCSPLTSEQSAGVEEFFTCLENPDRNRLLDAFNDCLSQKRRFSSEYLLYLPSGLPFKARIAGDPVVLDGMPVKIIGCVEAVAEDSAQNGVLLAQFCSMVHHSSEAVTLQDLEGNIVSWNQAAAKMYGWSEQEAMKMNILNIVPRNLQKAHQLLMSKCRSGEKVEPFETQRITRDGRILDIQLTLSVLPCQHDSKTYIATTERDITRELQLSRELHDRDTLFQMISDYAGDVLWIYDFRSEKFSYCSPSVYRLTGYTPEEMSGLGLYDILTPESARQASMELSSRINALESGDRSAMFGILEFDERRKNGSVVPTEVMVSFVLDKRGNQVGLVGIAREITDRIEQRSKINEIDALFNLISDHAGDVLWNYDLQARKFTYITSSVYRLLGYTSEEMMKQQFHEALPLDSASLVDAEIARRIQAIESGDLSAMFGVIEFEEVRKDGSVVPVEVTATFVLDRSGRVTGIVGMTRDITERLKHEQKKLQFEKNIHESQRRESIGRIAGGVAHELNNMLTPLIGYTDLLRDPMLDAETRQAYISEVYRSALKSKELVSQLLDYSSRQFIVDKPVNFNVVISDIEQLLRSILKEDISLQVKLTSNLPLVKADYSKFKQVIVNLANNAQDAMPQGGTLWVETAVAEIGEARSGQPAGKYVQIIVTDTGTGIDPEDMPHIFEPFFSTKKFGTASGLGLAAIEGIVNMHHGHIRVQSRPGLGTSFTISIPVFEEGEPVPGKQDPVGKNGGKGQKTVMVVEDEMLVKKFIVTLLTSQDYNVLDAGSGEECLEKIKEYGSQVDLLMTDIIMPGINGRELADELSKKFGELKVLFMSGYNQEFIDERTELPYRFFFMRKPFTLAEFQAHLRELFPPSADEVLQG